MSETTQKLVLWLIPLSPLVAAVVTAAFGPKVLRERSHLPCWIGLAVSTICSLLLLFVIGPQHFAEHTTPIATGFEWINVGGIDVAVSLRADALTSMMLAMVTFVSFLVAVFAAGYMHGDPGYPRFFAAVSLFVFSMCMLVLAANFLLLFVFWEGVGLCSYLLIGFWYRKPSAAAAAVKAFVVNRIGDFGFLLGIFLIWTTFGSLDFADVLDKPARLAEMASAHPDVITAICLLLLLGAMGKSAQFPLQVWLPDAMEGPTPVSALIHAATMVTAGVYMVARAMPLFVHSPTALLVVSGVGAVTALNSALIGLTQFDLKRVLAYSTVSQLGYMFMALGAGAAGPEVAAFARTAAMFHLFTHAFFKALLFLAAGSVMHSMGDVIDMRRFGGLRRALPITHWTFLCGAAALAGVPPLAGFWSKDEILAALHTASEDEAHRTYFYVIFGIAAFTALLTAFYTFRAYFMTFWGEERFPKEAGHHPHDAPPVMAWPLMILAVCAVLIGLGVGPTQWFSNNLHHMSDISEGHEHGLHYGLMALSAVIALAGVGGAWLFYARSPELPGQVAAALGPLYRLSLNKFYLDEIFRAVFVTPLQTLAAISYWFDRTIIDPAVDLVARIPQGLSLIPRTVHNGLVLSYALVMWTGLVLCVLFALGVFSQGYVVMGVLLLTMLILPAAAALALLAVRRSVGQGTARQFALAASLATLVTSLLLAYQFVQIPIPEVAPGKPVAPRFSESYRWFSYVENAAEGSEAAPLQVQMLLGLDGISLALIVLTTILTVSCVLISWESISERAPGFYACLLLLEAGLLGVFMSFDVVLFYVFFEFTLVPLFFMIGIWGGPQRRYAAIKFFLYTLVGSLVTLVGLVGLVLAATQAGVASPTSIPELARWLNPIEGESPLSHEWQIGLFLAIAVGFMVKVPVFPLHTWLPLAHVEAPTAGSVLLAGVLLKLGTYGFLRLCLPMFPYACETVGIPLMAALAVAGIIYGSFCALAQRDIKKLVAYSSVAHLGFCMLGLFALNAAGMAGSVLQMINHGLSTGALFLLVGMIYDRYHTRQLDDLGGLAARLPLIACTTVFIAMASIGLPGLNGFVGEMLSLAGMFERQKVYAVLGASGVVLGAWYMLRMIQQAFFGPLREPKQGHHQPHEIRDMNAREMFAIAPICVLCLVLGVMPQPLIRMIQPDIDAVVALYPDRDPPLASVVQVKSALAQVPSPQPPTRD